MQSETRTETLASAIRAANSAIPPQVARELAAVTVNANASRPGGAIRASAQAPAAAAKPPAANLTICPCGTLGSLPADWQPSHVVTCSVCNTRFKAGPPTKDGKPSVGIPLAPEASFAASVRAARRGPALPGTFAARVRAARAGARSPLSVAAQERLSRAAKREAELERAARS